MTLNHKDLFVFKSYNLKWNRKDDAGVPKSLEEFSNLLNFIDTNLHSLSVLTKCVWIRISRSPAFFRQSFDNISISNQKISWQTVNMKTYTLSIKLLL